MQPQQVEALLEAGLENCAVAVRAEGSHFDIRVIGEVFAGLRPVQKQQLIYQLLGQHIADGSMHAVNIRAFTPAEWAARADAGSADAE